MKKVVLLGANGQLGKTIAESDLQEKYALTSLDRNALDITDEQAVSQTLDALKPDIIINAAAYTSVDAAESDDLAAREVNAFGPKYLARWVAANQAWLLQISTDFIFCGRNHRPYLPDDQPDPVNIYGRTKLEGELHVRYLAPDNSLVLRTAWVHSPYGRNFVSTMLRLMRERDELNVVDDQLGTPTSTFGLLPCISAALALQPTGVMHWTDAGVASWYDFAVAIQDEALALGLLDRAVPIRAIPTTAYPAPAKRPPCVVLDKTLTIQALGCQPEHWRRQLRRVLSEISSDPVL